MLFFDAVANPEQDAQFVDQVTEGLTSAIRYDWVGFLAKVISGVIGVLVMLVILKIVDRIIRKAMTRHSKQISLLANFVLKLLNVVCGIIIALWFVGHLGLNLTPLLAGAGIASVVLGLALQETIGNFFSGLMIIINKPFQIGDYIENGGFAGTVTDMDMNRVVLLTPDNKKVTMSNKLVWGNPVVNYSAMDKRRVDLVVSVSYDTDIEKAKKTISDYLATLPLVLRDPAPIVEVTSLSDSSIDIKVAPWCKPADYWTVYFKIQGDVARILSQAGITVPYNQLDVHITQKDA